MKMTDFSPFAEQIYLTLSNSPQRSKEPSAALFPIEDLSSKLKSLLNLSHLSLKPHEVKLTTLPEIEEIRGAAYITIELQLSPLENPIFWSLHREDFSLLCSSLLTKGQKEWFVDRRMQEGFYHFLLLRILNGLNQASFIPEICIRLQETPSPLMTPLAKMDLSITWSCESTPREEKHNSSPTEGSPIILTPKELPKTITGSLFFAPEFPKQCHDWMCNHLGNDSLFNLLKEDVFFFSLFLGNTSLKKEEWDSALPGDFILLDNPLYNPSAEEQFCKILLDGKPLFNGRIDGSTLVALSTTEKEPSEESACDPLTLQISIESEPFSIAGETLLSLSPQDPLKTDLPSVLPILLHSEGKKIGKGELLILGETVGVRLLSAEIEIEPESP